MSLEERIEMSMMTRFIHWLFGENGEEDKLKKDANQTISECRLSNETTLQTVNETLSHITVQEANREVEKVRKKRKTRRMNGQPNTGRSNHIGIKG